jgi:hypothetical protein
VDRLGTLINSWDTHEPGGEFEHERSYWIAVIDQSCQAREELSGDLDFQASMLLGALEYAAANRLQWLGSNEVIELEGREAARLYWDEGMIMTESRSTIEIL